MQTAVEMTVNKNLSRICDLILSSLRGVKSVVITGSVARGDFAYHLRGGRVVLLSDFDIIVVIKNGTLPFAVSKSEKLEALISATLGEKVSIGLVPRYFWKRAPRTAFFYGMKKTGKTIYGENILGEIPVERADEIDKEDGLSILFNYINQLLSVYTPSKSNFFQMENEKGSSILSTSSRAALACVEALLILEGKYTPWPRMRARLLNKEGKDHLAAITKAFPEFPRLLNRAYSVRNSPIGKTSKSEPDARAFWFKSKECILEVITYYIGKHFRLTHGKKVDLLQRYASIPDKFSRNIQYFLLKSISDRRIRLNARYLKYPVKRRFQSAVFLLASSLKQDKISMDELQHAAALADTLFSMKTVSTCNGEKSWRSLQTKLATYWKYASPVLGL